MQGLVVLVEAVVTTVFGARSFGEWSAGLPRDIAPEPDDGGGVSAGVVIAIVVVAIVVAVGLVAVVRAKQRADAAARHGVRDRGPEPPV